MKLFEMEGFLRGKCIPGDMLVNETDSQYLVRKFAEAEAKCAALAAENAALKEYRPQPGGAAMMEALDAFEAQDDYPEGGMMDAFEILCCKRVKTPATDAFLAEVRAQGVEMFVRYMDYPHSPCEFTHGYMDKHAIEFAAKLRKGAAL